MANLPCTKDSDISSFFSMSSLPGPFVLVSLSQQLDQWLHPEWQLQAGQSSPWPLPVRVLLDTSLLTRIMSSSSSSSNSSYNWVFLCSAYRARIQSTTRGPSWPSMALTMRYVYLKWRKIKTLESAGAKNNQNHWPLAFFLLKISENSEGTWNHITNSGLCQKQRHKPFQYTSFWWGVPNFSRCWI